MELAATLGRRELARLALVSFLPKRAVRLKPVDRGVVGTFRSNVVDPLRDSPSADEAAEPLRERRSLNLFMKALSSFSVLVSWMPMAALPQLCEHRARSCWGLRSSIDSCPWNICRLPAISLTRSTNSVTVRVRSPRDPNFCLSFRMVLAVTWGMPMSLSALTSVAMPISPSSSVSICSKSRTALLSNRGSVVRPIILPMTSDSLLVVIFLKRMIMASRSAVLIFLLAICGTSYL
mmetsp:Transcript_35043/g.89539  ORF Transcript_35043/g.89539 Transcript_35043/m.89539 type:complete len:235 (-) Transcript_35043:178-882(-)